MTLDEIQFGAWSGLIHWLMDQDWAHAAFAAESGRVPLTRDVQTGLPPDEEQAFISVYTGEFAEWATRTQWGSDEVTPSIRAALDRFPRRQT